MVVVAEEIISFVRRLVGGVEVSPTTLAVEVIDEVGPGGDFLATAHTLAHFRSVWQPSLFDRNSHHGWVEAGRPNMIRSARDVAIEAIGSHVPEPLTEKVAAELREIVRSADRAAGVES
jgi:trimethylamine--corrinoid protein Co-methyltransferase